MSGRARPLAHVLPGATGRVIASFYLLATVGDFIRNASLTCGVSRGGAVEALVTHDRARCSCSVCQLVRRPEVVAELARLAVVASK